MILVTGSAGKTGRAVLKALTESGASARAVVYRPEQVPIIKELGVYDITIGDLRDPSAMHDAAQGIRAIYHICPNVDPHELEIGKLMIETAELAGIDQFVYHSVLHPQVESMPHHWKKLRVEERLFESKLAWTILQPAIYMQNILVHKDSSLTKGIYPVPYNVERQFSLVDLDDVAEAAKLILTTSGHSGATYELVGTLPLSSIDIASAISRKLDIHVEAVQVSLNAWERRARTSGFDDYQRSALVKMFEYYDNFGMTGSSNILSYLLSRRPTTFNNFLGHLKERLNHSLTN